MIINITSHKITQIYNEGWTSYRRLGPIAQSIVSPTADQGS